MCGFEIKQLKKSYTYIYTRCTYVIYMIVCEDYKRLKIIDIF